MNRTQLVLGGALANTDTGNVSAMVDALEADLRDAGHFVNIVAARNRGGARPGRDDAGR